MKTETCKNGCFSLIMPMVLDVLTVTGPDWDNIPHPCLPGFHLPSHHQQLLTTIAENI